MTNQADNIYFPSKNQILILKATSEATILYTLSSCYSYNLLALRLYIQRLT
jgi:hypothetical protein